MRRRSKAEIEFARERAWNVAMQTGYAGAHFCVSCPDDGVLRYCRRASRRSPWRCRWHFR